MTLVLSLLIATYLLHLWRSACTGEAVGGDALRVCYLRHAYGLGEHYNSVIIAQQEEEGEDLSEDA